MPDTGSATRAAPVSTGPRTPDRWAAWSTPGWRRAYAIRLVFTDLVVLIWSVLGAAAVTVDPDEPLVLAIGLGGLEPDYSAVSVAVIVLWMAALALVGTRDHRKLGTGSAEYRAIFSSAGMVLVVLALTSFAFKIEYSRAFVLLALPAGVLGLLASRSLWRQWLRLHRLRGHCSARVLLVGAPGPAEQIAAEFARHPEAGYLVVGVVAAGGAGAVPDGLRYLPVLPQSTDELLEAALDVGADTVVMTDGHGIEPRSLRELSWSLEPGRQHLVMTPSLTDVAGPRIHARPVAGLPLVHVETPRYEGLDRYVKRLFDMSISALVLLVLLVPLLAVALAVALTSPGGVFFTQERIGKKGRPFRVFKFRTMVPDADARLADLLARQGTADKPLFKVDDDPRITRVGRVLRRFSVDELPQLLNVLRGEMSLVGPRPQVAREVALYDDAAGRRLYVKPGMTGLWQVSGRSNLDWEESVRLDLYYVENWSVAYDFAIMARTVRAVFTSDGAV